MKRPRLLFLIGASFLALLFALTLGIRRSVDLFLEEQIRTLSPLPPSWGALRWQSPSELKVTALKLANPPGCEGKYFLEAQELLVKFPRGKPLFQAIPVELMLTGLSLSVEPGTIYLFGSWGKLAGEKQKVPQRPIFLQKIEIQDGRFDFIDRKVRKEVSVFTLADLRLQGRLDADSRGSLFHLSGGGSFVAPSGEAIGSAFMEAKAYPALGQMEAALRFQHDRLSDFRRLYHFAPYPLWVEGGTMDLTLEWKIREWKKLWVGFRFSSQDLQLSGEVSGIPWATLVEALKDPQGRIDLEASMEANLDEPALNVHDRLLSDLDWTIKERVAARGISIPGRIFFAIDE